MTKREGGVLDRGNFSFSDRINLVSRCELCVSNILESIIEEVNEGTIAEGAQIYLTSVIYSAPYAAVFLKGELGKKGYNGKFDITSNDNGSTNGKRIYKIEDYE